MKKTPLEKRIKRQITGRKHIFFAVCAPGLTRLCFREITNLPLELENVSMEDGGVEFTGSVYDCYHANLYLRSPSRILMRVAEFKAENFRTLDKKIKRIKWELFLNGKNKIQCHVTTHRSRLYHSDAISQRVENIITKYFAGNIWQNNTGEYHTGLQKIFIRAISDRFVVSIDSSGDILHKRGIKKCVGKAPLRENLGFAVLDAAGYSGEEPLFDPMCGSGTFSIEAAMILKNIPPGFFRNFAFQHWPCFSRPAWKYLKKKAALDFRTPFFSPCLFASDIDLNIMENMKKTVKNYEFLRDIKVFQRNFFDIVPKEFTDRKGIVVLNPPYGKRLGKKDNTYAFFSKTGIKLKESFKGWNAGIILPEKKLVSALPFNVSLSPFFHGGLKLFAATGKIV